MSKKRILFIDSGAGYGGSTIFLYYHLIYLNRQKYEPLVLYYFYNEGYDLEKIKDLGIPILFLSKNKEPKYYIPFKWCLRKSKNKKIHEIKVFLRFLIRLIHIEIPQIIKLINLLKRNKINLVVLNNDVHYHIIGAIASKIIRIPCICRKAGGIGEGKKIKKILTHCVDLFIAISKATEKDQAINNPGTKRLVTIYGGIDIKKYISNSNESKIREKFGIDIKKMIIGNISRFDKGKGQMELLESASIILKNYRNIIFLFVGDGELMETLKNKVEKTGLTKHIIFTGWRKDIKEILGTIDIFVHCPTTWIEGLGIATIEAMAMGKPCIVSNNGGLPDAVIDGETGFVVPIGDINKLADAILKLINDEQLRKEFGKNARKRAEEEFDISKNTKKMEALYEEYISPKKYKNRCKLPLN